MNRYQRSIQFLKNKARGGEANLRGNKYENYFAVFLLAQLSNKFESHHWNDILISTQAYEFVDDIMVKEGSQSRFFQLKSGGNTSWGRNVAGNLAFDFLNQKRKAGVNRQAFSLHLVVPSIVQQKKLLSRMPKTIRKCTRVEFFPFCPSMDLLVVENADFRAEMAKLCAVSDPPRETLVGISKSLLGAWVGSHQKDVPLVEILDQVSQISGTYLRPKKSKPIMEETKMVLDAIPGFSYWIENGYLSWRFESTDTGNIPYEIGSSKMNRMEEQIRKLRPTTFESLEPIII